MLILLTESDDLFRDSIEALLRNDGHSVITETTVDGAIFTSKNYDFDIILLGMVYSVAKIRRAKIRTPLIAIPAKPHGVEARVNALMAGADDVVERPLDCAELLARMNAVTRRSRGHAASRISVGSVEVDLDTRQTWVDGRLIQIPRKPFQLLELLITRAGNTVSRETIMSNLYSDPSFEPVQKIIDVFINTLRRLLAVDCIETTWGQGYKFIDTRAK